MKLVLYNAIEFKVTVLCELFLYIYNRGLESHKYEYLFLARNLSSIEFIYKKILLQNVPLPFLSLDY